MLDNEIEASSDTEVLGLMLANTPGDSLDQVLAATRGGRVLPAVPHA